ncbi:unnamed protein product [Cyclocybe aegerita]|uniref:Cas1p 10 TM acyl transferase domain-containing protein n=1 Tax=Cyclocybe aegerita TaxID=1973307 RepID=A0A8S0WC60_CYCAE|nr:unnamed protein product [Cyclocybe aegerita]
MIRSAQLVSSTISMASFKSKLNPSWPHFLGISTILFGFVIGLGHLTLSSWSDPFHCNALLNDGSWMDANYRNWQPDGCMLYAYPEKDSAACLKSKELIFIGDSVTRTLFFQVAQSLDKSLKLPINDSKKHSDHKLQTRYGTNLTFAWDPFLNTTYTHGIINGAKVNEVLHRQSSAQRPAMIVLGSGLWYLRYADLSGGSAAWRSNMERIFSVLNKGPKPADEVVILPVGQVVPSKLSASRAATMHPSDIDAMNSELYHHINPLAEHPRRGLPPSLHLHQTLSLPLVFNKMLDESLTEDGLHFADSLVNLQARILLNLRCNDILPKKFPLSKTCCNRYPMPSMLQFVFLAAVLLSGPYFLYTTYKSGMGGVTISAALANQHALPALIISASIALIYTADRTDLWVKEQKQFNPWTFGFLCISSLGIGLVTVRRGDKDLGYLNRDQTDEWKGWMQIAILVYHYFGASKISGIYNPIRVLVASYLFMTGYGHATFYIKKADFGFFRIAQVLVRLNFYTILLAYTMNTDYISYYFTPLVSMWYLVVYITMVIGARFNDRTSLLIGKILLSAAFMTWFMNESWVLEGVFNVLRRFCGIHWSAREWSFRVNLDLWIVHVGMLTAIAVIKFREYRLGDHLRWPLVLKLSIVASALILIWFFAFELYQESKFTYNTWHPYISFLPVLAFTILRNSSVILRSSSSRAFAFLGKCSLETFIVQYHFWLAGDSKGVLLALPGTQWRPINFVITSIMFVYLCDRIAYATGEITNRICGVRIRELPQLPPPVTAPPSNAAPQDVDGQEVTINLAPLHGRKDGAGNPLPMEPDTPIRPRRWVDRLAEDSPSQPSALQSWFAESGGALRVNARLLIFMAVLWLFNIFWPYPYNTTS